MSASSIVRRIADNPAALVGLVTALLGLLVLFHVPITKEQIGGIVLAIGAVVTVIQRYVLPKRKVITRVTNAGTVVAGQAATQAEGTVVFTSIHPTTGAVMPEATVKPKLLR